jgi:hypothetical protein
MSKADEVRRARDIAAIRDAADEATSMQGLAQAAGIRYPRLYNMLQVMPDGEEIRTRVVTARRRGKSAGRRPAPAGILEH